MQNHWWARGDWTRENWRLLLAVFRDGQVIGQQNLSTRDFATTGEARTGFWLGHRFQGQGYGTQMRAAALTLAFDGLGATRLTSTAFADNAAAGAHAVVDKSGYTLFTPEATELIRQTGWTDLVFCKIATESCVLKSAADAFEHGYAPWIVTDASASDAGPDVHDAGLVVARRLIGTGQLVTAEHVVGQLAAYAGAPVLE